MLIWLAGRLAQALLVLLVVAAASFALFRFVGDPVNNMVGQEASAEERAAIRAELGLDDPFPVQFTRFVGQAAQGDFGTSYRLQRPVAEVMGERLPATVELVVASALISILLGIPAGIWAALRPRAWTTRTLMAVSLVGVSLPTFVIGLMLIYLFAVLPTTLGAGGLPAFGRGEVVDLGGWTTGLLTPSGRASLILPAITLALFQTTLVMRLTRAEMLDVLSRDFIRFARARGLSVRRLYLRHALKNASLPVITIIGLNIGALIAFSIVTETVFAWPGLGSLFLQSVQFADVPLMATFLLFTALVFVTVNLLVDLAYHLIDPRLRQGLAG